MSDINTGLEGVLVAETKIAHVDGQKGQLIYQGYDIEDVIGTSMYEDVVYLLWFGKKPNTEERHNFCAQLQAARQLPERITNLITSLPHDFGAMAALRTATSALSVTQAWPPSHEDGISIIAKFPCIIAAYYRHSQGLEIIPPDVSLGHTENYLYMLSGEKPNAEMTRALDTYLMLGADHGMNASTFTARVVTSTCSDIISAVTAGIGALKGPLHGGAPSIVDDMLDEIGSVSNVTNYLEGKLKADERLMGFGHRVYKTYDPRAGALRKVVESLPADNSQLELSLAVEKEAIRLLAEYKPGRNLYPNVEFWAAAVLRTVGVPRELYPPTFAASRTAGWTANIFEQAENNRLVRPSAKYVGRIPEKVSDMQE